MAFNQDVYNFVVANLNSPSTILAAMQQFGVDVNQLADAIGMPASQITSYFQNAGIVAPGMSAPQEQPQEQPPEPPPEPPPPEPEPPPPTYYPADDGRMFTSSYERDVYNNQLREAAAQREREAAAQRQKEADAQSKADAAASIWTAETGQEATTEQKNAAYQTFLQNPSLTAQQGIQPWIDKYKADLQAQKEAEAKQAKLLNDAVTSAIQNGMTVEEIKSIAKELNISEAQVNAALEASVGSKEAAQIVKDVSGLVDANNQISMEKVVKYADENKLPYASVSDALAKVMPGVTTDSLVYEKDRQQISSIAKDGKVDLGSAIALAIKQSIEPNNLAKFFSTDSTGLVALAEKNLGSVANALRTSGIDPGLGMSDLLGLDKTKTVAALKDFDLTVGLNKLAVTTDGKSTIPMDKAFEYAKANNISDADLGRYLNITQDVITKSRDQIDTKGKLDALQATDNTLTLNEVLGLAASKNMTPEDFAKAYLGGGQATIDSLNKEASFTPQERTWREAYTLLKTPPTIDQTLTFQNTEKLSDADFERIFGDISKLTASDLDKAKVDQQISALKESGGKLTSNELLGLIGQKQMTIDDFVKTYLGDNKETLAQLKAESVYSPQERTWRETMPFDVKDFGKITEFQTANKLSDADMERVFGIPTKNLDAYRVTTEMNKYAGEDKQLSYAELAQFAKDNNMDLSKLASYLGTDETRPDILKNLQAYVADAQMTPKERLTNQLTEITSGGTKNGVWDKNSGWTHHLEKMVNYLEGYGIKDLNQIGTRVETRNLPATGDVVGSDFRETEGEKATNYVVYFDKATGKELQAVPQSQNGGMWRFGSEGEGSGSTGYFLGQTPGGGAGIASNWEEKYGAKEYALPLAVISAIAAPYLLPELIGAAGAAVDVGAVAGGTAASTAIVPGTGLTGMLMTTGMSAPVATATATAIVRGTYQGLVSEAAGGDFSKGFIAGGVAPVISNMATQEAYKMLSNLENADKTAFLLTDKEAIIAARAIGSSLNQLMVNGDIDLTKTLTTSITPLVVDKLVEASGKTLTAAQAKFIVQTAFTGGQNITAMATNPLAVLNFVQNNAKLIDEIASGVSPGATSTQLNTTGLNEIQKTAIETTSGGATNQVVVTGGQDTTLSATGQDTLTGSSGTVGSPSVTVTGAAGAPTVGGALTQDVITAQPPPVTTVADPSVTVTGVKPSEGTASNVDVAEPAVPVSGGTGSTPVVVTSTKDSVGSGLSDTDVITLDTPSGGGGADTIPGGSINAGTVTVTAPQEPITADPLDLPPVLPPSTTTSTTTTTGGGATTTNPPITVPPIIVAPGTDIPVTQPANTSTVANGINYEYPNVPAPELPTYYGMPYPNYLRPMQPYLPMGLASLMENIYAQEPGYGVYQPLENAGSQIKIPT